jgi:ADP-heptose:LPS heptosyltransferase
MLGRPGDWPRLARESAGFAAEIRQSGYEVALDFQGNLKGALHARMSGAPRRIGFARGFNYEKNHWFSTEQVRPPADRPHRVEKFASLLAPLGIHSNERRWVFPPSPGARQRIARFLEDRGIDRGELVVVHPGTSGHGAEKRWSPDRFAALALRIASDLGRAVVVSWGPGEEKLARAVCVPEGRVHGCPGGGRVFAAPRSESLLDVLELLRAARVFVSADTGPMHMAAACGVPCVALFGPKDPAIYAPWGEGHRVIYRPDEPGQSGMERIAVEEAFAAVGELLGAP